ncbi:hypothetical protein L7F22_039534 [Adiantum nelumboides]|nr:hypothetical protein [Adiantum nelumboides]
MHLSLLVQSMNHLVYGTHLPGSYASRAGLPPSSSMMDMPEYSNPPATCVLKSGQPEAAKPFQALKQAFTTASILIHADPTKPFILETDASDFALGAILSQVGDDGRAHPVAFHSRKFLATEINYEIHDKELLAIIDSFETWRHLLEGAPHKISVYTDHKNLEYFMASRVLNRCRARWSGILSRFNFVISYRPGHQQGKPDALSRRSYLTPKEGDAAFDQQESIIVKPEQLKLNAIISNAPKNSTFLTKVRKQTARDPLARNIRRELQGQGDVNEDFQESDGLVYYKGLLYIPQA